jgi:WD40 repeat protein
VAFSPDGKTLASGGYHTRVKLWDVATAKEKATLVDRGKDNSGIVYSVAFSQDGKNLAWPENGGITLWNVSRDKTIAILKGHTEPVQSVAFSPDGKCLASGGNDQTVEGHNSSVYSVAFSPDGKTLASGSEDRTVKLWDVARGKNIATLKSHTEGVRSVAFSPDGKTLASGSEDGTVKLWDVGTGTKADK